MKNLLIAAVAGLFFTVGQLAIGRLLRRRKILTDGESIDLRRNERREEILWVAVATGVFILVVLLCLTVWERQTL